MMLSTNTCEKRGVAISRHIVTKSMPTVHSTNGLAGASNLNIGFCLFIGFLNTKLHFFQEYCLTGDNENKAIRIGLPCLFLIGEGDYFFL